MDTQTTIPASRHKDVPPHEIASDMNAPGPKVSDLNAPDLNAPVTAFPERPPGPARDVAGNATSIPPYSYDAAFDRNIGWVTEWEQQALRGKRVALAGMGGVGGVHMLTLARFGVGAFNTADFDKFDIVNFNRQIGANVATIGRPKAEVIEEMARAINPGIRVRRFDHGIDESNIDDFLKDVDVFIDGFDFFVLGIRRKVFDRCAQLGIPALCAAPLGMGVGFLAFLPGHMSFEEYFRLEGRPETEQYLRFLVGLVPRALHRAYLVDGSRLDLAAKRGPSTGASCQLCASVAAVNAVKLMLGRGGVRAAPFHHHYDPYVGRLVTTRMRWGNDGPLQKLKIKLGGKAIAAMARRPSPPPPDLSPRTPLGEILNAARWAPSGDNTQPWRFEIVGENRVVVHLGSRDDANVYQYRDSEPTLLAGGALLETLRIAGTAWGRRMDWRCEASDDAAGEHRLAVDFTPDDALEPDRLFGQLHTRSVDRRPYRRTPLGAARKAALIAAAGDDLVVDWHEDAAARWKMARLGGIATDIRLRAREAFEVHRSVIDWTRPFSPDGLPGRTLGLAAATLPLMKWAMGDWARLHRLNQWTGTWLARAQLDYLPGLGSGAFFTMRFRNDAAPGPGPGPGDGSRAVRLLRAGQGVQRFWLEAARLGLAMQPGLAILAFAEYGARGTPFTDDPRLLAKAKILADQFRNGLGAEPGTFVFVGRVGEPHPRLPLSRSIRRSVADLSIVAAPSTAPSATERQT